MPKLTFKLATKPLSYLVAGSALLLTTTPALAESAEVEHARRVSNRILAALAEANGVPGMAAAIWKDGETLWHGETGYRDAENQLPVDEDTVFRFASVSKIFAVVAAARLREQGKLEVDKPVEEILGDLDTNWTPMTSRQLAAHTSGIPHYQDIDANRGGRHFASEREAVEIFNGRDLLFAPGSGYNYSSYGYTLLGAVIEQSADQPFLDYLAGELAQDLAIGPDATDTGNPDASRAYDYASGTLGPSARHDYSYSMSGAGLGGTAKGLARFGGRMLSGTVISDTSLEWMLEPARLAGGTIVMEREFPVGFGLRGGTDADGERIAHHAGVTQGARSILLLYPDREFAVSFLSNAPWVSSIEQTAITLSAPFRAGDQEDAARPCPLEATRYEGNFRGEPVSGDAHFVLKEGICSGRIAVSGSMADWFNGPPQKDATTFELIGLDSNGGLSRAALVTPFGAYDLRAGDADTGYLVRFGGERRFSLDFQ